MRASAALRRRLVELLRDDCSTRAGLERIAPDHRAELERLPIERDVERIAHWLLEVFERDAPPVGLERLSFRVLISDWHGRTDGADLELCAGDGTTWRARESAGSAVLAQLARSEPADALPLCYAALAAREALARIDPELLLGRLDARSFTLECADSPALELGELTRAGWER